MAEDMEDTSHHRKGIRSARELVIWDMRATSKPSRDEEDNGEMTDGDCQLTPRRQLQAHHVMGWLAFCLSFAGKFSLPGALTVVLII